MREQGMHSIQLINFNRAMPCLTFDSNEIKSSSIFYKYLAISTKSKATLRVCKTLLLLTNVHTFDFAEKEFELCQIKQDV